MMRMGAGALAFAALDAFGQGTLLEHAENEQFKVSFFAEW